MTPHVRPRLIDRFVRTLIALTILAVGIGGFLWLQATGPETPPGEVSEREWRVAVHALEWQSATPWFTAYGQVSAPTRATLRALPEGEIVAFPVRAGDRVEAGDLLVQIDPTDANDRVVQRDSERAEQQAALESEAERARNDRQAVAREREQVDIAVRALERVRDLRARQVASATEVDQARNELEQAQLRIEQREQAIREAPIRLARLEAQIARTTSALALAQRDLAATRVAAPWPARIIETSASVGERVRSNDPLLSLYPTDSLEIAVTLPARALPAILDAQARGATVTARLVGHESAAALPLVRLAGNVQPGEVGRTGFFAVGADTAATLALDQFVTLRVALPAVPDVAAVPREALHGDQRLYSVEDGRLRAMRVERIGEAESPDLVLVRMKEEALPMRPTHVVTTRLPNAIDGLRVQVVDGDDEAAP